MLLEKSDYINKVNHNRIPSEIILMMIYDFCHESHIDSLTLNELVNSKRMPGKIFNLTQSDILKSVYILKKQGYIDFIQTNNLDTIRIKDETINDKTITENYYKESRDLNGTGI